MAALTKYDWNALALLVPVFVIVGVGVLIIVLAAVSDRGLRRRETSMWDAWHKPIVGRSSIPAAQKWAQTMAVIEALESPEDDRPTPRYSIPVSECSEVRSKASIHEAITVRYPATELARLRRLCA
jgi:hypothetical protein